MEELIESKIVYFDPDEEFKQKAIEIIKQDEGEVTEFKKEKLEKEAAKHWNVFYKRNQSNFFKDRHYLLKEFAEMEEFAKENEEVQLLDCGCGVGNALFPLSESLPNLKVNAFDFAQTAVQLVEKNE